MPHPQPRSPLPAAYTTDASEHKKAPQSDERREAGNPRQPIINNPANVGMCDVTVTHDAKITLFKELTSMKKFFLAAIACLTLGFTTVFSQEWREPCLPDCFDQPFGDP